MTENRRIRQYIGAMLLTIAISFTIELSLFAPWYLDKQAFVLQPVLAMTIPLSVLSLLFFLQSRDQQPPLWIGSTYVVIGLILMWFVAPNFWPAPYQPTTREDSYQALAALEVLLVAAGLPLWIYTLYLLFRRLLAEQQQR